MPNQVMRVRRPVQQAIEFDAKRHGGKRAGAGRKKDATRNLLPHGKRAVVTSRTPVHVTLRVRPEVWNLRRRQSHRAIVSALEKLREAAGARFVHYSVQGNHVHLVAEATDRKALARRVQGLEVRIARALNKLMNRTGAVFADRYHARVLATPLEVRRVLEYVLKNRAHHVGRAAAAIDACSSAAWFDGWSKPLAPNVRAGPAVVSAPRSWLLTVGWRRHGRIER
jgi:REP element-mobilizing transposase RayT